MIDLLPCGCAMISEWEYPAMEHITEAWARYFEGRYPRRRLVVVVWIGGDGQRSAGHECESAQRFNASWALAGM